MKTLAKFLLRLSLAVLPCLAVACTSEVETTGGTPETLENPQANDPNRRSVVISLQNKLILVQGTPESRPMTRDGIAEDDENRIGSFDIYAFGSDKEEGPYTFQERFAYRAEAGKLPAGVSPLDLKSDEVAGKVNVVFYPRKGLFTKFYCVANQTEMNDVAGHEYTGYTPLQQTSQQAGTPGDAVTAPGIPTENDFIKLNTPLLEPTGFNTDILLAPLPMSGANGQPVDLREYSMGTYVRLNISLSRAVARFDVVNDAAKSHFTITDIAMGNGRQGVTLFPIRPIGDVPAVPGQLITYPYRPFDGLNANVGTTTKAFYCYPCKAMDEGFLILKGLYAVNLTDEKKEVSYRIPFERVSDGNGTRIEINHNHRYTVQITEADPFEVKANIRLVDWETGDYIDDYEPDNGLDAIIVSDLLPDGETSYDVNTSIVTLALKKGSSFIATTGSNAGVETKLTYYGGSPQTGWLKLEEIPVTATRAGGTQQVKYKVSFNEDYTGDSYPRGILRLIDKAGGGEEVILIDTTYGIPTVESTGGTMSPDGVNNWDAVENTLHLVQATGGKVSTGKITVTSIGGSKVELPTGSGITVTPTSSPHATQEYTFQWAGTDATDLTEKELSITLKNNSDETKIGDVKVKLLPNRISNLQLTNQGSGISLSGITATTATLTMPIIKDRQFTLTMSNYGKPTVSKCPSWLQNITPASTRGTPGSTTTSFTFKLNENAANFNDTQIVFANATGGTGMTVNVTRQFQTPTISAYSMDPSLNSYVSGSKSLNLYQLKSSYNSTATLKVYSLGGSKLEFPANVTANLTQSTAKEQNYVIRYNSNNNFSLTDVSGGTLNVRNLSDETKNQPISVTFKTSLPTVTSNRDGSGITYSRSIGDVDVYVDPNWGTYGETGFVFTFTSPTGYSFASIGSSNNANTRTEISTGSQSGSSGSIKNAFTLSFKSTATFSNNPNLYYYTFTAKDYRFPDYQIDLYMRIPVYKGKTPYKQNGLWAMPAYSNATWSQAVSAGSSAGDGWRLASMGDYRKLIGWTASEYNDLDYYTSRTLKTSSDYINKIFLPNSADDELARHWSSESLNVGYARAMGIYSSTTGGYSTPAKSGARPYVLVHNE
ncbi:hypothetical protein [Bacteroides stercorirosoris]|uniref:hypothetical protein n=1 Tax=Bacteroides stercorirosoris TaxID=871324 RepID=UPI0023F1C17B|nr:hypothetical protein [Bacteroides stercorirosoris]